MKRTFLLDPSYVKVIAIPDKYMKRKITSGWYLVDPKVYWAAHHTLQVGAGEFPACKHDVEGRCFSR